MQRKVFSAGLKSQHKNQLVDIAACLSVIIGKNCPQTDSHEIGFCTALGVTQLVKEEVKGTT